ncbi:spinster family MFS transporter [Tsuneonella mangrovi]|uniref:spinster family MFS transporter n=1 Tax=Tsuneonella mangrovi TaxID=1982042 RepID=UPI000BA21D73|nr:MFS transporter [Tsuneonella mangrovi]
MSRLRRPSPALALTLLTAIGTIGFVDRIVVNALVEPLKAEFHLDDTQIGLLGFAYAALNILLGLWIARLAERKRRLSFTVVGTLLWSIAAASCGLVQNWTQLLLSRIAVGVGEAVGLPANQSVVADYFPPEKRASAMSVMLLAPPLGIFIGLAGGGYVAQHWGWREAFFITAAPGVVLALLVWLFVKEPPRGQHDKAHDDNVPPIGAVIRRFVELPSARHLVAGSVLASLAGFGLSAFFAAMLMRRFGISLAHAGLYAGLITSLPASLSVLSGGALADKLAPRFPSAYALVPGISLAIGGPLYAFAVTRNELWLLMVLVAIAVLLQFTYLGMTFGTLQNMMHPRMRATANALLNIIFGFAGGIGPVVVGAASDRLAAMGMPAGHALSVAMAWTAIVYLWAALHYLWAARDVAADLAIVREGRI